jgi:DNA replication protein DnaC
MLQLATAKKQERLENYIKRSVLGPKLLVIDEIDYLPFGCEEANLFFNVIAKLYEYGSVISRATYRSHNGQRRLRMTKHSLRHY